MLRVLVTGGRGRSGAAWARRPGFGGQGPEDTDCAKLPGAMVWRGCGRESGNRGFAAGGRGRSGASCRERGSVGRAPRLQQASEM